MKKVLINKYVKQFSDHNARGLKEIALGSDTKYTKTMFRAKPVYVQKVDNEMVFSSSESSKIPLPPRKRQFKILSFLLKKGSNEVLGDLL